VEKFSRARRGKEYAMGWILFVALFAQLITISRGKIIYEINYKNEIYLFG
jgi:hypothetical protein